MENNLHNYKRKMAIIVVGIHVVINLFVILSYGASHPITPFIRWAPEIVRIIAVSIFAFLLYATVSYFITFIKRGIEDIFEGIDFGALLLFGILLVPFLAFFIANIFLPMNSVWLLYALINPVFGNAFASTTDTSMVNMLWVVSTIIPSLGIVFGMSLRIKHYERKIS